MILLIFLIFQLVDIHIIDIRYQMSSTSEMLLRPALTGVIAGTAAGLHLGNAG